MVDHDGITYLDTYFIKRTQASDEALHFHELVHVVQWRALGPERFLRTYADGLERFGYRNSPLERMAYDAGRRFSNSREPFNLEQLVLSQLEPRARNAWGSTLRGGVLVRGIPMLAFSVF